LLLKANVADVYTKTASDAALTLKANAADVYTKTDADAKYRLISESYTKTQTDAALALKANLADVYAKTDTYTKSEVDAKIPTSTDLTNYYTKPQTDDLINEAIPDGYFNPFLSYSTLPAGKVGFHSLILLPIELEIYTFVIQQVKH
jgi:hypothetical protein